MLGKSSVEVSQNRLQEGRADKAEVIADSVAEDADDDTRGDQVAPLHRHGDGLVFQKLEVRYSGEFTDIARDQRSLSDNRSGCDQEIHITNTLPRQVKKLEPPAVGQFRESASGPPSI